MSIKRRKWKNGWTYRVRISRNYNVIADASFDTKADAEAYEADIISKWNRGDWVDTKAAEDMTLCEALDKYNESESKKKKGDGYKRECSQTRQIKKYKISKLPLAKIKSADVATFRDARLCDVGANSVRLALALIGHTFTIARQEWHMDYLTDPVRLIKKPSVSNTARDRRLLSGEESRLLASATVYGGDIADIIIMALETAMRQSEITTLMRNNVDLNNRVVQLFDTKNGTSREIPLSLKATDIVTKAMAMDSDRDTLFSLSSDSVRKAFRRSCSRADEPIIDLRFHDLRHEAISRLFEKGLSTEQVMSISGHKTYAMLARYTHLKAKNIVELLG